MTTQKSNQWWLGKSQWFDDHWAAHVTPAFIKWWLWYYSSLEDCVGNEPQEDDVEEYFTRMAFAMMGWNAALENKGKKKCTSLNKR